MIEIKTPKPGTEKFIKRFEAEHAPYIERGITPEEAKEKIRLSLERIRKEIESTPEFRSEVTYHSFSSSLSDISNILAQAIKIALEEGVDSAVRFILSTGNPHLIDMLHDILIEHFFEALVQSGKIKLIK